MIIRCCGKESCHKVVSKQKSTTNSTAAFIPINAGTKSSGKIKTVKTTRGSQVVTASKENFPSSSDEFTSSNSQPDASQQAIIQDNSDSTPEEKTSTSVNSDVTALAEVISQTPTTDSIPTIQNEAPTSLNEPLTTTTSTFSPTVSSTTGSSSSISSSAATTAAEIISSTTTTTTKGSTSTTTSWQKPTTATTKIPQVHIRKNL